jgi:hypothetical protein
MNVMLLIFESHAVISKQSSDALTSHKVIKINGNDGTTVFVHGVILTVRTVWCKL